MIPKLLNMMCEIVLNVINSDIYSTAFLRLLKSMFNRFLFSLSSFNSEFSENFFGNLTQCEVSLEYGDTLHGGFLSCTVWNPWKPSREPLATCGCSALEMSKLKCAVSVRGTLAFKDLIWKHVNYLIKPGSSLCVKMIFWIYWLKHNTLLKSVVRISFYFLKYSY